MDIGMCEERLVNRGGERREVVYKTRERNGWSLSWVLGYQEGVCKKKQMKRGRGKKEGRKKRK